VTAAPGATPVWKNPFVVAFVLGALALTALPLLQRRFLSAPPPLRPLGTWELSAPSGARVGSAALKGKVFVAQVVSQACPEGCLERVNAQAALLKHLEDLGDRVLLVTVVVPAPAAAPLDPPAAARGNPRWHWLTGEAGEVDAVVARGFLPALQGWGRADAGRSSAEFSSLPSFSLVDQNGDVRGFWTQDELGRGNLINAARLLARHGPNP
jgi:cytochrome oxidase Cu insertion factor (SCO1/SenC/PrrC family)